MASGRADWPLSYRLERTVAWMDTALAVLHDGVALLDGESATILFASEAFSRMAGQDRIFLLGKRIEDVLRLTASSGAPLAQADLPWSAARRDSRPQVQEYSLESPQGMRHFEIIATAFDWTDENGKPVKHIIMAQRDITDRKRAQDALLLAKTDAEAANKELETFCYSIAHDLRAPLRSMDGFSQVLLEGHSRELDEEGKDCLKRIRLAAARMGKMIDDLLKLSRVTRGEMRREPIDLSGLAKEISASLRSAEPGRDIEFTVAPGLKVEGDVGLLCLVLENLLGNAWKFTRGRPKAHIEFAAIERDGKTVYFVRDDGAGFDMAHSGKLFTPFGRLHTTQEFEGTGIGLATVERIIARHGGRIWGEGKVGLGAAFFFSLGEGKA